MTPRLPDVVCLVVCLVAALLDLRTREIPDGLTGCGVVLGLGLAMGLPLVETGGGALQGLALSAGGGGALFAVFGLLAAVGFMGMGDVKLMAAVGTLLGWPLALRATVDVLLAGGLLSLAYALGRGVLGRTLTNLAAMARRLARPTDTLSAPQLTEIPYGLAILAGVAWAIAARYWPAVQFP